MTDAIVCRNCGEELRPTGDPFCTFCHEPLDDGSSDISQAEEMDQDGDYLIKPNVFGVSCYTRRALVFDRCYKCDATSNLATTSVAGSRSIASYVFVFVRGIELLKNRTSVNIPICTDCRFSIWPLRFAHLAALATCFALPFLYSMVLGDKAAE